MRAMNMGDMARTFMLQNRGTLLKTEMNRLTEELTSGRVSDARRTLDGSYGYLNDMERSLKTLAAYEVATSEATHLASGMQSALGLVNDVSSELAKSLMLSQSYALGAGQSATVADQARQSLETIVSSLNTRVGGRVLFSGMATDTTPLGTADDLLTMLTTAVSGATTPDDIIADAEAWFANPAGFSAVAYNGSPHHIAALELSETEKATLNVKVDDPEIKSILMNSALAALADSPALGLSVAQQSELHSKVGTRLLGASQSVTFLQGQLGFSEARIEQATARNAAQALAVETAISNLVSVDPFQTATELEAVQFQLESLYTVTARMSRLSLVNHL